MPDYIYAYQGKFIAPSSGKVIGKQVDPYNPLGLRPYTMRLKFAEGYDPSVSSPASDWTLVDSTENIWDGRNFQGRNQFPRVMSNTYLLECISANMRTSSSGFNTSFQNRFNGCSNLYSVSLPCTDCVTRMDSMFKDCTSLTSIPATLDTSGCENMSSMFQGCTSLTSIPETLDTSACKSMGGMFRGCTSLTSIPATLDTSACTGMTRMFQDCVNVQSGALAFYQQASTQTTPPSTHTATFLNCGASADPSAPIHAEMAQIPTSWGGTMA